MVAMAEVAVAVRYFDFVRGPDTDSCLDYGGGDSGWRSGGQDNNNSGTW